jgi:hypothetical protein
VATRKISIIFIASSLIVLLSFMPHAPASYAAYPCTPPHQDGLILEGFCWPEDSMPFILTFNATSADVNSSSNDNSVGTLHLGLYENGTLESVPAVSYYIKITEARSNETFLKDVFHAKNGTLVLRLFHNEEERVTVRGAELEPFLNAWVPANNTTKPITISSRQLSQDGIYNINIEILGFANIRNLIPSDQVPEAIFVWDPASDATDTVTIVPEFSSIAVFAIATAMVGIVVAASRFRLKSSDSR